MLSFDCILLPMIGIRICFSYYVQDNWPSVLFAMAGGVVLSLGNLFSQYAWAFVGLSVTEVITASITVVIGISLSYTL